METERVAEAAPPPARPSSSSMATSREAAHRDAPPPPPYSQPPSHAHSRVSSMGAPEHQHGAQPYRPPPEVELNHVLTRLEQQVSFNYNMIQGHHQDIARVTDTVARMQHEMVQVIGVMEDMRNELRARPLASKPSDPARYDPADVEILTNQITNVTSKVNEVDNLKVQIELMKQRLKRVETQSSTSTAGPPPETTPSRADQPPFDAVRGQQQQPPPHQPVPSIRPGAALSSDHGRQPGHPPAPVLESQATPGFHAAQERQPNATEQAQQPARQAGFRAAEPLPPPGALSGWRPAESFPPPPPGGPPPPGHSHPLRSHPTEPEPQASGWAAVNNSQVPKRSLDEYHPHHETSQPGSPKRPKLAPLKPRSSFGDDHHHSPYAQAASIDPAHQGRGRIPSGDGPAAPHGHFHAAQAPGQGTTSTYRFITSTGQPDHPEHWRPADGDPTTGTRYDVGSTGRGRGRGSRGGRRGGRGSRGGRSSSGAADQPPVAGEVPLQQEQAQPPPQEWREHQWVATQQGTSNGHFPTQHTYSPIEAARQTPADHGVHSVPPPHGIPYPAGHEHEFPATPVPGNAEAYAMGMDLDPNSASKKTRTKPIRNSDGVLIRKDGRPDMRSVSSANNLRKVHAKKEAEKAIEDGRTPTSGRSLAPANSSSLSDDEAMEEGDYMEGEGDLDGESRGNSEARTGTPGTQPDVERSERLLKQREIMGRMLDEGAAGPRYTAEAWFPRTEGPPPPLDLKREGSENKEREVRWRGMGGDTTMKDRPSEGVERETSQRTSERGSLEHTPHTASEPPASEQPGDKPDPATTNVALPEPVAERELAEKENGKKDSTQLQASAEGPVPESVPSEIAA
ncbi:hypothetical protein Q7P37_009338 [Cladosporium fusiforme]